MFVCPWIVSIIRKWWTRCNIWFIYLFVLNQLHMFRAMFPPIIRSIWLYLQLLIQYNHVAADRYRGRDGNQEFHLVLDIGWQQHRCTISEAANTVKCSWWWGKISPEKCRADWVQINKPKVASCWSSITKVPSTVFCLRAAALSKTIVTQRKKYQTLG